MVTYNNNKLSWHALTGHEVHDLLGGQCVSRRLDDEGHGQFSGDSIRYTYDAGVCHARVAQQHVLQHGRGHLQQGYKYQPPLVQLQGLQARSKDQEILEEGGGAGPSLLPRRDHE